MKKKILSFIFIIICLPVLVFAKDKPFYKKFQTSDVNNYFETSFLSKTIELKNNYYTLSEIKELTSTSNIHLSIKKYDFKGNLIKEKSLDNVLMIEAATDDNYLYILSLANQENTQILKIDTELNTVSTYTFTEEDIDALQSTNIGDLGDLYSVILRNIDLMTTKNNYVNVLSDNYILQFDLELNNLRLINNDINNIKELFPKFYKLVYLNAELYDTNGNHQVYLKDATCSAETESFCGMQIKFLDNNDFELWSKNIAPYDETESASLQINDIRIVDEYVVVLETLIGYNNNHSKIVIYNFDGSIVQEISNDNYVFYNDILPTSLGFKVLKMDNTTNECISARTRTVLSSTVGPVTSELCSITQSEEFYYLYYLIDSKVTGNGKIEVSNKAKAGEQVSFKTQADPNYTVKNVTVKDINGNPVNINNGSFTMPEDDVIIEAEFIALKNPYTKGGLIVLIGIIIISIGSYFLIQKTKQKI